MDLRHYIDPCAQAGELRRVGAPVDWNLEISHISKLVEERKGPALLFENVRGYDTPVFTGAFATTKRLAIMLGQPHSYTMCESAQAWMRKSISAEGLINAREVKDGPVLANVLDGDKVDLNMFPVPKFFPLDGGRYIGTTVFVVLKDPETGETNLGTYRMQMLDGKTCGVQIGHLFTFLTTPPRESIIDGVHKLEPGHVLVASAEAGVRVSRYWAPRFEPASDKPESYFVEGVRGLVEESVKLRLVSDVPLGAFLSGGIDSSAVVATMARLMSQPVQTFSIGFAESDFNELRYARMVAERFGTDHHELVLEPSVVDIVHDIAWYLDEPFCDSSAIPTYLVSQMACEHVTVALSGDGGDEVFAGYDKYLIEGYKKANSTRILKVDAATGKPVGEFVYQLDAHTTFKADKKAEKQSDVRLSEITAVGQDKLVVLERISKTTKLHLVDLASGTNILGTAWDDAGTSPSLEQVDLAASGVRPLTKTLWIDSSDHEGIPTKIEGVAISAPDTLVIVNDDDFGIDGSSTTKVLRLKLALPTM